MVTTNLVEAIASTATGLPLELQREALSFVEFLALKASKGIVNPAKQVAEQPPIRNVIGLFDHLGIDITAADIAEARREMWGNFPREFPRQIDQ